MSLRKYYITLVGMMVIMMAGVLLLVDNPLKNNSRNPNDVADMERIRRSALDSLVPVREMIGTGEKGAATIRVGGLEGGTSEGPNLVTVDFSNTEIAMDLISSAMHNVVKTSEWLDGIPYNAPPSPPEAVELFRTKDRLWELSIEFIDTLGLIYGSEVEIPASKVISLEDQMALYAHQLNEELDRLGLETVE